MADIILSVAAISGVILLALLLNEIRSMGRQVAGLGTQLRRARTRYAKDLRLLRRRTSYLRDIRNAASAIRLYAQELHPGVDLSDYTVDQIGELQSMRAVADTPFNERDERLYKSLEEAVDIRRADADTDEWDEACAEPSITPLFWSEIRQHKSDNPEDEQ